MQPHESDIPTSQHRRITNLDFLQILFTFGPRDSASELRSFLLSDLHWTEGGSALSGDVMIQGITPPPQEINSSVDAAMLVHPGRFTLLPNTEEPRRAGYTLLFPPVARPKTSGGESPDRQPHPAWLSCPRDRSRQLRVELQLDRACHIGYIDIGNSGSAFLQIDVGRSIWTLDKGFTTLLPTTTLMPPADARLMKNHRGVRMFKEGDFLAGAALEKWDRVTCTQPFNKQEQFGLSFIRVLSTPDEEDEERLEGSGGGRSCPVSPLHSGEQPTLDAQDPEARSQKLRDKLQSVASPPPASMSRSARMLLLSAAKSRKHRPPITAVPSPSIPPCGDRGSQQGDSPVSSGSCPETPMTRLHPSKKEHETPNCRLKMEEARRR
ncbi:uncharacterized protein LOC143789487 [Ranitomeya variabilis]|uniref:uncharacterized protein LOC143789487 n=1 Tax=Ranitomeya variabilis TaxID=490064 RepID=UPI0040575F6E